MIVGIDEVGRGAWAGPMVVGAVVLGSQIINGLTDSKCTTKKQRYELNRLIKQHAKAIGLGWVSAKEIDTLGLSPALKLAARRALSQISVNYDEIIIDGTIRLIDDTQVTVTTMKKADLLIPSVSAASIAAKCARDEYMSGLDTVFSGYKFTSHVGYGTAAHRRAIEQNGILPVHRQSFAPITAYTGESHQKTQSIPTKRYIKTTTEIGNNGEDVACKFLIKRGHTIMERNWKVRGGEIDIVSRFNDAVYFTEVKYRSTSEHGGGLSAVTSQKLRQMRRASLLYLHSNKRVGRHATTHFLSVIDVSGHPPIVHAYLESVS